jgi:hypothetical protein
MCWVYRASAPKLSAAANHTLPMPAVSVANTMAKGITLHLSHQNNDTTLARHQTDTPVIYKGTESGDWTPI